MTPINEWRASFIIHLIEVFGDRLDRIFSSSDHLKMIVFHGSRLFPGQMIIDHVILSLAR